MTHRHSRHHHIRTSKQAAHIRTALLALTALALAALSVLAAALVSGCNPGDFGSLSDETWVDSTEAPEDLNSDGYGAGVTFAGTNGSGTSIAVASLSPPGVTLLEYDEGGGLNRRFTILNEPAGLLSLPARPAVAAAPGAFSEEGGNVAIAATSGDVPYAVLFSASSFQFPTAIAFGTTGGLPQALAFGGTDASSGLDLVGLAGGQLWLVPDYLAGGIPVSCALSGGRNLIVFAVDESDTDGDIVVATGSGLTRLRGSDVVAATCEGQSADVGEGETDFGAAMATGNFDGGETDIAVGAPSGNAVYVILNQSVDEPIKVSGPSGSVRFGEAVAAGDIDGDGADELVVGDSGFGGEVAGGGAVYIMGRSGDSFEILATLFDADPEEGQAFGRSVAIASFSGSQDILVVGASEEVFTYFRHPLAGDQDVRR